MADSKDNVDRWLKGRGEVLSALSQCMRQQIWDCLRDDKISVFSVWYWQGVEMEEFRESSRLFEVIIQVRALGIESLAKKMQVRFEGELIHLQDKLTRRKSVDVGTVHFIEPERQLEVLNMFNAKGRRNRLMEMQMGIKKALENPESVQISIAAKRIKDKLSGQRFILILEDVWESFDLQDMGVPVTTSATTSGSKVMITTQSHEVCSEMGGQHLVMQHPFQRMVSVNKLLESFEQSFPSLSFPPLPERGDFDLKDVLDATYFFNPYSVLSPLFFVTFNCCAVALNQWFHSMSSTQLGDGGIVFFHLLAWQS